MPTTPRPTSSLLSVPVLALLLGTAALPLAAQSGLAKDTLARDSISAGDASRAGTPPVRYAPVADRRDPLAAGALELFVPIAGHAYAGNWARGIPSAAVSLAAAAVAAGAAGQCTGEVLGAIFEAEKDPCREEGSTMNMALVVFAASRMWGAVSAALTADAHNRSVLQAVTLEVVPRSKGAALAMAVRW